MTHLNNTIKATFIEGSKKTSCKNNSFAILEQSGSEAPHTVALIEANELPKDITLQALVEAWQEAQNHISANYIPEDKSTAHQESGWHIFEKTNHLPIQKDFVRADNKELLNVKLANQRKIYLQKILSL